MRAQEGIDDDNNPSNLRHARLGAGVVLEPGFMDTIDLETVKMLDKRLGAWVWDGVIYNRDGITNPKLGILPNAAGSRLRRWLAENAQRRPNKQRRWQT